MWDNVDAPETQVEDASAGTGKETHLEDVLVITPELQISGPFLTRFPSNRHSNTPTMAPRGLQPHSFGAPAANLPLRNSCGPCVSGEVS